MLTLDEKKHIGFAPCFTESAVLRDELFLSFRVTLSRHVLRFFVDKIEPMKEIGQSAAGKCDAVFFAT